jgi:hypothetical protein
LLGERIFPTRELRFILIVNNIGQVDSTIYRGIEIRLHKQLNLHFFCRLRIYVRLFLRLYIYVRRDLQQIGSSPHLSHLRFSYVPLYCERSVQGVAVDLLTGDESRFIFLRVALARKQKGFASAIVLFHLQTTGKAVTSAMATA